MGTSTHRRVNSLPIGLAMGMAILGLAPVAAAGPDWEEGSLGTGDAGSLPGDAQVPKGQPPLTDLLSLSGNLTGFGLLGTDFQDLYIIYIDEPLDFLVITGTGLSVQLWLFRIDGLGLLGTSAPELRSVSTDGSGAAVTMPGLYVLGVSALPSAPIDAASAPLFFFASPGEISGPDGPGGPNPVANWTTTTGSGAYTLLLTGVVFPPCRGDVNQDGAVDVHDLVQILQDWGSCPPGAACPSDTNGDGLVDVTDLLEVIVNWGQCNAL